jgi:flavin-dependent thymidylate synthase
MKTPIDTYIERASRMPWDMSTGGITKDVAFNRHSFGNSDVRNPLDNGNVMVGTDGISVELVQGIDEESFRRTLSRAVNATLGVDPADPPEEADWEEMLKGGLQTALETQVIVFGVSGVSRACTHQLVRSRRASFHQQSMRAHYYGDEPETRMPESVWANEKAREAFLEALSASHEAYRIACEEDIAYQDARYILTEGTENYILLEYPVREFLDVYAYRACSMFQWEIVAVMRQCREVLVAAHPWIEPYVKISCEKTKGALDAPALANARGEADRHHCTFQGWEQVEGQCDFPWARESNRSFVSERHQIKRKEAMLVDEAQAKYEEVEEMSEAQMVRAVRDYKDGHPYLIDHETRTYMREAF